MLAKGVVEKHSRRFFWAYDSSLRDHDIEVVSKPFAHTPSSMKILCDFFAEIEPYACLPKEYDGSISYGLHVTVSGYGTQVAIDARRFIRTYKTKSQEIAGRSGNRYCDYTRATETHGGKSCALNIRNSGAAEFRIFRATTQPERLKYRTQYALSVMHFMSQQPTGTWADYKKFISSLRRYEDIAAFVKTMDQPKAECND